MRLWVSAKARTFSEISKSEDLITDAFLMWIIERETLEEKMNLFYKTIEDLFGKEYLEKYFLWANGVDYGEY